MKNLFCWGLGTLVIVATFGVSPAQSGKDSTAVVQVKEKLIGAWRLAWIEEEGADGKPTRIERQGIIVYTRDGHMSVQIMAPKPETLPPGGPVRYEQGGYEAYYGTYEVNEQAHTVTHHVEGALVRSLIGNNLTRTYRFSEGQLILKSSRPDEHWTVAWEHY
jgi:hypothetical protein